MMSSRGFSLSLWLTLFVGAVMLVGGPAHAAVPTFTSFSPGSAKLGTSITINGTNFVAPVTVSFNGIATSSVTINSSTKLTADVPFTASTGKITIKAAGGSVTGGSAFMVVPGIVSSGASGPPDGVRTHAGRRAHERAAGRRAT